MLLCCITLSSSREYNTSSRSSKKNSWRRCREIRAKSSQDLTPNNEPFLAPLPVYTHKSRHTKYPSQTHLPRIYIICHLPLVFLSPTSPLPFYSPSLSLSPPLFSACLFLFACVFDYLLPWRKIIPNCVIYPIPIIMISLVLRLLLLMMLSLVKSILLC